MRKSIVCFALLMAAAAAWAQPAKGNVYRAGGEVHTGNPVTGDFTAVGGRVVVDAPVTGDLMAAGGNVDVRAPIGDDARVAGGTISIDAPIGGELLASGGEVTLSKTASVAGNAKIYGGTVTVDGPVRDKLHVGAGHIVINSEVTGDVRLDGDDIELGPSARITGSLEYASANELKKAEGAVVTGTVKREASFSKRERSRARDESRAGTLVGSIVWYAGLLACAALFLLLFPVFSEQAAHRVRAKPGQSFGAGLLTLLALPVAFVLLLITILGIPIAFVVLVAYPFIVLAGFLLAVLFLAHLLAQALKREGPLPYAQVMGYVALTLLVLVVMTRVPVLGKLIVVLLLIAGVGGFVVQLAERWRGRRAVAA